MNLSTIRQFAAKNPAWSEASIRNLIAQANQNGLAASGAVVRLGARLFVNETKWFAWVEARQSARDWRSATPRRRTATI